MKCLCHYCSGEIEFDEQREGETVACLHCELDTVLYKTPNEISEAAPPQPPKANQQQQTPDPSCDALLNHSTMDIGAIVVSGVILGLLAILLLAFKSNALAGLVIIIPAAIISVTWLIFPFIVYRQLDHQVKLLQFIAKQRNKYDYQDSI